MTRSFARKTERIDFKAAAEAEDAKLLAQAPALKAYIDRIGAEIRNFRRYEVEDYDRAPSYGFQRYTKAKITIASSILKCDNAEFAPTEAEADAISTELAAVNWPHSVDNIFKSQIDTLKAELGGDPARFCEFLASNGDEYLFVQERIYPDPNDPTKKHDLPWTMWSDNRWRQMAPEGKLPLYNLPALNQAARVMIHEGAMTARRVIELLKSDKPHPWKDELASYRHLGWPGGADNPQGVEWAPLNRQPHDVEVTAACDNDQKGIAALTAISQRLQRPLKAILFDDNFNEGFDLADEFPKVEKWWEGKRYKGPTLDDYVVPATWATTTLSTGKAGRPAIILRPDFAKEWIVVGKPPLFTNKQQPRQLLTGPEFDRKIKPFSDTDKTGRLLEDRLECQVDSVTYSPKDARVFRQERQRLFNTYMPGFVRPMAGDAAPWLKYLKHLVPKEVDRTELKRWCATLIARPEIRMGYGALLISNNQGVGKSTLAERILAPIIGKHNTSFPNAKAVADSDFNHWIVHKRLVVIHEIYTGHSRATYDMMKTVMTDDYVHVNMKNLPPFDMDNWVQVYACSNSFQALHLDPQDRRWLVPEVTEEKWPKQKWLSLNAWLIDGGLSIIAHWANEFLKTHEPVMKGEDAPVTDTKKKVISASRNPVKQLAQDFKALVEEARERQPSAGLWVFTLDDLHVNWFAKRLRYELGDGRIKKAVLRQTLTEEAGLFEPEIDKGKKGAEMPRYKVDGALTYVIGTSALGVVGSWGDVSSCHVRVADLEKW